MCATWINQLLLSFFSPPPPPLEPKAKILQNGKTNNAWVRAGEREPTKYGSLLIHWSGAKSLECERVSELNVPSLTHWEKRSCSKVKPPASYIKARVPLFKEEPHQARRGLVRLVRWDNTKGVFRPKIFSTFTACDDESVPVLALRRHTMVKPTPSNFFFFFF